MAIITVNAPTGRIARVDDVRRAVEALGDGHRVTLMIHGFRYCPTTPSADPHRRLYATDRRKSCWKSVSWAHYLHLDRRPDLHGIGFGWPGLGRLDQVAARAFEAGQALAALINLINQDRPDLRLGLMAHSLGARVALRALRDVPAGAVETGLLLSGAAYRDEARAALGAEAAQSTRFVNVISGENLAFDVMFRLFAPARHSLSPSLAQGLGQGGGQGLGQPARPPQPGWIDLAIDRPAHLDALAGLGYRTAGPRYPVCHWSSFIRPGLFPLYRHLLGPQGSAVHAALQRALCPGTRPGPALRTDAALGQPIT